MIIIKFKNDDEKVTIRKIPLSNQRSSNFSFETTNKLSITLKNYQPIS